MFSLTQIIVALVPDGNKLPGSFPQSLPRPHDVSQSWILSIEAMYGADTVVGCEGQNKPSLEGWKSCRYRDPIGTATAVAQYEYAYACENGYSTQPGRQ